jgi:hypothetical protein
MWKAYALVAALVLVAWGLGYHAGFQEASKPKPTVGSSLKPGTYNWTPEKGLVPQNERRRGQLASPSRAQPLPPRRSGLGLQVRLGRAQGKSLGDALPRITLGAHLRELGTQRSATKASVWRSAALAGPRGPLRLLAPRMAPMPRRVGSQCLRPRARNGSSGLAPARHGPGGVVAGLKGVGVT